MQRAAQHAWPEADSRQARDPGARVAAERGSEAFRVRQEGRHRIDPRKGRGQAQIRPVPEQRDAAYYTPLARELQIACGLGGDTGGDSIGQPLDGFRGLMQKEGRLDQL